MTMAHPGEQRFDLVVVVAGSGGLAAAKRAASTWGLRGRCGRQPGGGNLCDPGLCAQEAPGLRLGRGGATGGCPQLRLGRAPLWRPGPMCCWTTCAGRWIVSTTFMKRPLTGPGWRWCGGGVTSWTPGTCRWESRCSVSKNAQRQRPPSATPQVGVVGVCPTTGQQSPRSRRS